MPAADTFFRRRKAPRARSIRRQRPRTVGRVAGPFRHVGADYLQKPSTMGQVHPSHPVQWPWTSFRLRFLPLGAGGSAAVWLQLGFNLPVALGDLAPDTPGTGLGSKIARPPQTWRWSPVGLEAPRALSERCSALAARRKAAAARLALGLVFELMTRPPVMRLLGLSPSQDAKCFKLVHRRWAISSCRRRLR